MAKAKKAKAKNKTSEFGGDGEHAEKTYEEVLKADIVFVDGLINSRTPLSTEEDDFVDWVLNKEEGRKLYQKYKNGPGCMPTVKCIIQ